jgi:hypothetical protein
MQLLLLRRKWQLETRSKDSNYLVDGGHASRVVAVGVVTGWWVLMAG